MAEPTLRELAEAALATYQGGEPWFPYTWGSNPATKVYGVEYGNGPRYDMLEGMEEPVAAYVAAAHPRVVLEALCERDKLLVAIRAAGFGVMQTSGDWSLHDVSEKAAVDDAKTAKLIRENIDLALQVKRLTAAEDQSPVRDEIRYLVVEIAAALAVKSDPSPPGETVAEGWARLGRETREKARAVYAAIVYHHAQKGDDRCFLDDEKLYAAAGLPPADVRVGDKAAMLKNCERFIENRCAGGAWPTYAELEIRLKAAEAALAKEGIPCPALPPSTPSS